MTDAPAWRLQDALDGDEQAWTSIVDEFLHQIWYWARGCGLTRHDAEDVAQTVWYKLKDQGHTIDDPRRLPGWLATTTRREAIATKRRNDRALPSTYSAGLPAAERTRDPMADPEGVALVDETRRRLARAYKQLSEQCQELLSLCWSGDLEYQDIAEILGRSVGSIGPTRQRCLQSLRKAAGL